MMTRPDDTIRPGVPAAMAKRMFAAAADPDRTIRPKELLTALATLLAMLLTDHQAQGGDPARLRAAFDAMVNETLGIRPSGSTH